MVLPATAGNFTSVNAGNTSLADFLVQTAYDLYVRKALNTMAIMRQFITVRPERQPHPGDAVVLQKFNWFANSTLATTPLTEEADVDAVKVPPTTPITITPQEYGFVVSHTRKLAGRALAPFEEHKAQAIIDHMAKTLDVLFQTQILADVTPVTVDGGAEADLTSADVLTTQFLQTATLGFLENGVPTWDGEHYLTVAHPRVIADIRTNASPNGWRVGKEAVNDGSLKLLPNEAGVFDGIRYISNPRLIQGQGAVVGSEAATYNTYTFGKAAFSEAVITEPGVRVGPQVDNLGRFHTLGWYADLGFKVYEPLAVQVSVSSASTAPATANGPTQ